MTVPPEPGPADEDPPSLVLRDEEGTEFAFRPIRALRDGTDVFVLAEREEAKTLHVLKREGDLFGLVRDAETLGRVALRLEVLRRAMEGELIEWASAEGEQRLLGAFHRGQVDGHPYLLAADLADPADVLAFDAGPEGVSLILDERRLLLIHEQLEAATRDWDAARPNLEAALLGLRREAVEVTDARGNTRRFTGAGRFFFEGRDLLFLIPSDEPERVIAAEVKGGGRIELPPDDLLGRLHAHLDGLAARRGQRSPS